MGKDIRVGDAERHNALDLLSTHFANGLIDINEFEDRTEKAAVARTRGGLVHGIDAVVLSASMILFFLGLFVFDWSYFWVVFPIAGIASWGVREAVKLSDDDEKLYEELKKKDAKDRAERLRLAAERRKELGQ